MNTGGVKIKSNATTIILMRDHLLLFSLFLLLAN